MPERVASGVCSCTSHSNGPKHPLIVIARWRLSPIISHHQPMTMLPRCCARHYRTQRHHYARYAMFCCAASARMSFWCRVVTRLRARVRYRHYADITAYRWCYRARSSSVLITRNRSSSIYAARAALSPALLLVSRAMILKKECCRQPPEAICYTHTIAALLVLRRDEYWRQLTAEAKRLWCHVVALHARPFALYASLPP